MNLAEWFELFLEREGLSEFTRQKYQYRLRPFVLLHGQKLPAAITKDDVARFIASKPALADPSKQLLRNSLHALFAYCLKGTGSPNPVSGIPKWRDYPRRVHLPDETAVMVALETAVTMNEGMHPPSIRDGLIFALAVVSGNRRGELRNLPLVDVLEALEHPESGEGGNVYRVYTNGKTGDAICRFTEFHRPMIARYLAVRPATLSPAIFVNLNTTHPKYGQKLSLVAFDRVRPRVCKIAGVQNVTYQELRRRLATHIARAVNVDVAAQALNHSPHTGDRVIRAHYYDPDKAQVDAALLAAFPG
jgi:integrase